MIQRLQGYHLAAFLIVMLTIIMAFALGSMSVRVGNVIQKVDDNAKKIEDYGKMQGDINKMIGDAFKKHKADVDSVRRELNKLKETRNDGAEEVPAGKPE